MTEHSVTPQGEPGPDPLDFQVRHEPSGISVRAIVTIFSGTAVLVAVTMVLMRAMLAGQSHREPSPAATTNWEPEEPVGPRVQPEQSRLLRDMTREKEALLRSYGSVDAAGGIGRIPVDRAMDVLAERGLDAFHELAATPLAKPGAEKEGGTP